MMSMTPFLRDPIMGGIESLMYDTMIDEDSGIGLPGHSHNIGKNQLLDPRLMSHSSRVMHHMARMNRFPVVHVKKSEDEYKITAETPGVEKSDLKVEICSADQGVKTLCISGERRFEDEGNNDDDDDDQEERSRGQRGTMEQGQGQGQGQRSTEQGQQKGSRNSPEKGQKGSSQQQQQQSQQGMGMESSSMTTGRSEEKGMKGQKGMKGTSGWSSGNKGQGNKREAVIRFCRSISLPHDVDEKSIKAKYENGLLKVCLRRSKGSDLNVQQINLE